VTLALKEWHVVSEAIARGDQVLTLRKGGIGEKDFTVAGAWFWLFPTWEHQAARLVKRAWRGELERSAAERGSDDAAPIRCACRVEEAWHITDQASLDAIERFHLWTSAYMTTRLDWRPTKPLTVMLVRAAALVEPIVVPRDATHAGCRSWLELDHELPEGELIPSLTDEAFALHAQRIRSRLGPARLRVAT
jgi:hypothetical protein